MAPATKALAIPLVSVEPHGMISDEDLPNPRSLDSLYPRIDGQGGGPSIALSPSLHDVTYYKKLCLNRENFMPENSDVDVFEVREDGVAWRYNIGDDEMKGYFQAPPDNKRSSRKVYLRVFFCHLSNEKHPAASFDRQISLTQETTEALLSHHNASPQFLPLLLGQPHYWAPGDFVNFNKEGFLNQIEFFCQHPRWDIHRKQVPWSVYMSYDVAKECATYIIVSAPDSNANETVKKRLKEFFPEGNHGEVGVGSEVEKQFSTFVEHVRDPYFLHALISHESFEESKSIIHGLRRQLYDQLDKVDAFSKSRELQESNRLALDTLTKELHVVSQNADSLIASAEMAIMNTHRLTSSHERYMQQCLTKTNRKFAGAKIVDSNSYMLCSLEAQKRWLLSYKSRKDIAMNLVFNLVTQQDSQTNLSIARDAKSDSTSMNTIAALTMVFLPGTFVAGIFGMSFFSFDETNGKQNFAISEKLWLYFAIAGALTIFTLVWWMTWDFLAFRKIRIISYIGHWMRGDIKRNRLRGIREDGSRYEKAGPEGLV